MKHMVYMLITMMLGRDIANKISGILYTDKPLPFPCSGKKIILMAHIMPGMRCRAGKLAKNFPA